MQFSNLKDDFNYLFNCDFFSNDFDPEGHEDHLDFAEKFLKHYPWEAIYPLFFEKLTTECATEEAVYNYINLFYYYGFVDYTVNEPYKLVGYVLYRIDTEKEWDKYGDFVDSFIIEVLETCGKLNLQKDPYYQPWKDQKILDEVSNYQKNNVV